MRKTISVCLLTAGILTVEILTAGMLGALAAAAKETHNLKSVHEKLEADKKKIVEQYMDLTDAESQRFWPVYDQYQTELERLAERTRSLLASYAADQQGGSLSDEKAQKLLDEWIAIDQDEAKSRAAAAKAVLAVLPPKKAARYLQIESEYRALLRYDLAATVPLAK
jgi:Spy/CpxP family protein refolding chaperone